MLVLQHVSKSFAAAGTRTVLRELNFELADNEYVAVMGESGIGKSTLLNLVAGLDSPDEGLIELDGQVLTKLSDDAMTELRRERMGFVFQAFHILPYLTVAQNVALPLELIHWRSAAVRRRVMEMLASVGLAERAFSMPRELSGGEMQRVAIARALAHRPRLVLADEPTGNLDPESANQVLALLASEIKRNRASGILVTHSRIAASSADRTMVLRHDGFTELQEPSDTRAAMHAK